ncbi:MAG: iron chelate uptake ABC transporter family permease subunit, partial [Chloroflexi bacterium]|nr:iron chelate uptake ABC transporter family permease subunit [Chloroflexota bacterium]
MKRVPLVVGALALLLVLGVLIGVALGPVKIDAHRLISAILLHGDSADHVLIWDLRMPRVVAALLVGSCLGGAGCLLQSATRNPLGDPQLFGLGGGAAIVQALAMAGLLRMGAWGLVVLSVVASLVGAGAIALFAS